MASETTLTFTIPGINMGAVNAKKTGKRKSDAQIETLITTMNDAAKLERQMRDELNPVVSRKRSAEQQLVDQLVLSGHRAVTLQNGVKAEMYERKMDAPIQDEIREGLEELGYTPEQIDEIKRVFMSTKRVKYDIKISIPEVQDSSQPPNTVAGIVAAIEGQVQTS